MKMMAARTKQNFTIGVNLSEATSLTKSTNKTNYHKRWSMVFYSYNITIKLRKSIDSLGYEP